MGDIESFGADPRRIEYAGSTVPGVTINWKSKYQRSIEDLKGNYAYFEVPYNGKDNDDYVNGEGFCCSQNTALRAGIGIGNVNYEKMQYYYHPDHLGSSSYITNLDGEIVQHVEYVPFGEVFIEERNNSWNTPYLFNGKELDEETGLYYYGARYYNPRESIFLSVDPMFEKTMTPYQYAYQYPIKYIDPTGMEGESADDIIIKGKDNYKWTIKAEGEDKTINVPVNLGSDKNIDLGLGNVDPNRFIVGYTANVGLEGSLGIGVSGNVNVTVAQFTDPSYAGYNVYAGEEHVGSAGAQFSISASVGASVFVGYNTDDKGINPKSFAAESYTLSLSADIKAIVGGYIWFYFFFNFRF